MKIVDFRFCKGLKQIVIVLLLCSFSLGSMYAQLSLGNGNNSGGGLLGSTPTNVLGISSSVLNGKKFRSGIYGDYIYAELSFFTTQLTTQAWELNLYTKNEFIGKRTGYWWIDLVVKNEKGGELYDRVKMQSSLPIDETISRKLGLDVNIPAQQLFIGKYYGGFFQFDLDTWNGVKIGNQCVLNFFDKN